LCGVVEFFYDPGGDLTAIVAPGATREGGSPALLAVCKASGTASITRSPGGAGTQVAKIDAQQINTFDIRYWDGKLTLLWNGKVVYRSVPVPMAEEAGKAYLMVGGRAEPPNGVMCYRDLKARRLKSLPPAPDP
jgi:hypothetical protein